MNKLFKVIKSLLISEPATFTPREIEITPGGTADTKTSIISSQTVDQTLTLPDITDTIVTRTNTEGISNKTISSSTVDSTPIGQVAPAAVTTTSLVATTADINAGTIDATVIGATTPAAATVTSLVANTVDINGGTIDDTVIGATTPAAATVTSLTANSASVDGSPVTTAANMQTLTNKSLDDSTTRIVDIADPTKKIAFDAAGTTASTTTILSSQTVDRTLTLPDATDTLVARNTTDTLTNKTFTAPAMTSPTITGGTIDDTVIGGTTPAAATFTSATATGNVIIQGDLTVNGTTVTVNTDTLAVEDKNITVNNGGSDASSEGAGLTVDRTGTDGSIIYKDASATKWAVGPVGSEQDIVGISASQNLTNKTLTSAVISGGTIDNTIIGGVTPAAGTFTTLSATSGSVNGNPIATTSSTQTLTNKNLEDATTAIVDSVDATKRILFDAAGATGTATTLVSTQNANRSVFLPDASTNLIGDDTINTLTGKTLQFTREAVATNNTTTGTTATLAAFNTGVVRLTNASLVSLSAIPAGVSGQYLTLENLTTATLIIVNQDVGVAASDRICTGSNGDITVPNTGSIRLVYDSTTSRWMLIGSSGSGSGSGGSGSGEVNFVPTGDAETTNPFLGYTSASAGSRPTGTQTLGAADLAMTISPSDPLAGNNSFILTKTALTGTQGQNVSAPFTVQPAYRAKALSISFDYIVSSGTFLPGTATGDGHIICYILDVTNNVFIEPSNFKLTSNSSTVSSKFEAQFQTSATGSSYRLIFHSALTEAIFGFALKIDNIKVAPSEYVYGTPVTDWQSYTPTFTGMGTVTAIDAFWRRVGDTIELDVRATTGTMPGGVENRVSLPTGYVSKSWTGGNKTCGSYFRADTTTSHGGSVIMQSNSGYVTFGDSGTFNSANVAALSPTTAISGNATGFSFFARIPTAGLSSSVQMSDSADTRVVEFKATATGQTPQALNNTTAFTITAEEDTHGAVASATQYKIPVAGYYFLTWSAVGSGVTSGGPNQLFQAQIFKNAVALLTGFFRSQVAVSLSEFTVMASGTAFLNAGDLITVNANTNFTTPGTATGGVLSLMRISGPSAIAATETIAAAYHLSVNQALTANVTAISYDTKEFDTHNAVSSGIFTAPAGGLFEVTGTYIPTTTNSNAILYKNGTAYKSIGGATTATYGNISTTLRLAAGDTVQIRSNTSTTMGGGALTNATNISITRIGL